MDMAAKQGSHDDDEDLRVRRSGADAREVPVSRAPRAFSEEKYGKSLVPKLIARQKGKCPYCPKPLGRGPVEVDHRKTVKQFADDLTMPLTEAYLTRM
jgi:hypothetical protein